jgi:hypothetical protein
MVTVTILLASLYQNLCLGSWPGFLKDNVLAGSQMCIVKVPRIDLAIALIDRMKKLFAGKYSTTFDTRETGI